MKVENTQCPWFFNKNVKNIFYYKCDTQILYDKYGV